MNLKIHAYKGLIIDNENVSIGEIHLFNDEIISIKYNVYVEHFDFYEPFSKRQKYDLQFLDKHHTDVPNADTFAKLTYENRSGKKESVFIKVDTATKAKLKWANKMTLVQKNATYIFTTLFGRMFTSFG